MIPTNVGRSKANAIVAFAFLLPVIWFAVILAQEYFSPIDWTVYMDNVSKAVYRPFDLHWTENTLKTVGIFSLIYVLGVLMYLSEPSRFRHGIEHGSAKWATPHQVNAVFEDKKNKNNNFIVTQNVKIGLDVYRHNSNLHVLCIGGSGAGKSRSCVMPNLLEANCNYVTIDPSGELLRATGEFFRRSGYDVRVLNLVDMGASDCFNPFPYFHNEEDVLILVDTFIKNTTDTKSMSTDPFWEKAERFLIAAICFYLREECPPEDQNFTSVLKLVDAAQIKEDQEDYVSALDILFADLKKRMDSSVAVYLYKQYKIAAGKTAKSILIQVAVRLVIFAVPKVRDISCSDDMRLVDLATKKVAIFCVIPDTHTTFNALVGMLYSTLFTTLTYVADNEYHGMLPRHVRCMMDEFRNVKVPDDFLTILPSVRKRNISISIFLQNMSQLRALFKDEWESVTGNCDTFIYLGGNEDSTLKLVSEKLGNETLDKRSYGISRGGHGSSNENRDTMSHALLSPNEIKKLNRRYCIAFMMGQDPLCDRKFELKSHRNYKGTSFGGAPVYFHTPNREVFDYSSLPLQNDYSNIQDFYVYE
jgi:type IV secretion system protein VirD4